MKADLIKVASLLVSIRSREHGIIPTETELDSLEALEIIRGLLDAIEEQERQDMFKAVEKVVIMGSSDNGRVVGIIEAYKQLIIKFEEAAAQARDFLSTAFDKISSYIEEKNQDPERIIIDEGFRALIEEYQARCILHLKQYNRSFGMGLYHKARNTC